MPWRPFEFRGQTVFVRVLPEGKPMVRRGMVEFRYKQGATKSYKTARENLEEMEGANNISDEEFGGRGAAPAAAPQLRETPQRDATSETIVIHTDGACSGNPGPAGIGVHIVRPDRITEISEFIANATNNAAELTAILRGLESLSDDERKQAHVHLYTDSGWSIGVLIGGWNYKTNVSLIEEVKAMMGTVTHLELLKVKGHAGEPGNEEADYLATRAVRREESSIKDRPRSRA